MHFVIQKSFFFSPFKSECILIGLILHKNLACTLYWSVVLCSCIVMMFNIELKHTLTMAGEGSSSSLNKNTRGQSDKGRGDDIGVKKGDDFQNVSGEQLGMWVDII